MTEKNLTAFPHKYGYFKLTMYDSSLLVKKAMWIKEVMYV